jgi:hypothetical protein
MTWKFLSHTGDSTTWSSHLSRKWYTQLLPEALLSIYGASSPNILLLFWFQLFLHLGLIGLFAEAQTIVLANYLSVLEKSCISGLLL